MTAWGPRLAPAQALRLYGLSRRDLLLLALSGAATVDGGQVRLASGDRAEVGEMLAAARALDHLRSVDATNAATLGVGLGDLIAMLDALGPDYG